ncbi:hypothetical protein, partial [Streptomyces antibioticus]|uniref:hypothetical protein n=1 Tax=Streptomyces antibioticus TaxID=1890 RepID=UPI003D75A7B3
MHQMIVSVSARVPSTPSTGDESHEHPTHLEQTGLSGLAHRRDSNDDLDGGDAPGVGAFRVESAAAGSRHTEVGPVDVVREEARRALG